MLTTTPDELAEAFPWLTLDAKLSAAGARYNIAPSQPISIIPNTAEKQLTFVIWGLIPFWAKDSKIGHKMINARAETLAEKPSFKAAYKYRRCLIPASGFYEWQATPGSKTKTPHLIQMQTGEPFAFAGIWERWQAPDGSEILSAAIITTQPNEIVAPIHNRMPVILPPDAYTQWLAPGESHPDTLSHLLSPFPANNMEAYPVSTLVNNPANNGPECIEPAGT